MAGDGMSPALPGDHRQAYGEVARRLEQYREKYMGKHLKAFLATLPAERPVPPPVAPPPDAAPPAKPAPTPPPGAVIDSPPALLPATRVPAPQALQTRRGGRRWRADPLLRRYAAAAALIAASVAVSLLTFEYEDVDLWSRAMSAGTDAGAVAGIVRPAQETTVAAVAPVHIEAVLVEPGQTVAAGTALFVVDDREARLALPAARLEVEDARLQVTGLEAAVGRLDRQLQSVSARLSALSADLDVAARRVAAIPTPQVRESTTRAAAAFEQAELKLNRLQQLFTAGVIARQQVDDARIELRIARDDLDSALRAEDAHARIADVEVERAQLRSELEAVRERKEQMERAAELARARIRYERAVAALAAIESRVAASRIQAPAAGVVVDVRVSAGDLVSRGAVLARVADLERLVADVQVPSPEVARLQRGGAAQVTIGALTDPARQGTIRSIEPNPGPNGTHRVVVAFDAPRGVMVSGQAATVTFNGSATPQPVATSGSSR